MKKTWKKVIACFLALAVMVTTISVSQIYAAKAVDLDADATITVSFPQNYADALNEVAVENQKGIEVALYRVADVDVSGNYTALEAFANVAVAQVSSESTADDWNKLAEKANACVTENVEPAYKVEVSNGSATADVEVGLYLVKVADVQTADAEYSFTSYLVAVPGNEFYTTGDDTWVYDIATTLKADKTDRLGKVEIDKTLTTYNDSLFETSCVFEIKAEKDYGTKENPDVQTVYSNVVAMDFSTAKSGVYVIEDLPAGAKVTVSEVYAGAGYVTTSATSQEVTVVADDTVNVVFTNQYNDELLTGGNAIVNSFTYDETTETWSWSNGLE